MPCDKLAQWFGNAGLSINVQHNGKTHQLSVEYRLGALWVPTSYSATYNPRWETPDEMWRIGATSWSIISSNQQQSNSQSQTSSAPNPTPPLQKCETFYDLIYNNKAFKNALNDMWKKTYEEAAGLEYDIYKAGTESSSTSPGEHGAIAFFDESDNVLTIQYYAGYKKTTAGNTAGLPDDYLKQLEKYKQDRKAEGKSQRILFTIHTHPPEIGGRGPSKTARSQNVSAADFDDITRSAYGPGPLFGILVLGENKFKVYGRGNSDEKTLRQTCITKNR